MAEFKYNILDVSSNTVTNSWKRPDDWLEVNVAYTPEGINVGWKSFDTLEQAMVYFNIKLKK